MSRAATGDRVLGEFIARRRKQLDLSQGDLGSRIGVTQGMVSQWELGTAMPGAKNLRALQRTLGADLPVGNPQSAVPMPSNVGVRRSGSFSEMPVRYKVSAGSWREVDDDVHEPLGYAPIMRREGIPGSEQWAELVEGDCCDLIFPDGSYIHVRSAWAFDAREANGKFVVVERVRNGGHLRERTVKQIANRSDGTVELVPRSSNSRWKPFLYTDGINPDDDGVTVTIDGFVIGYYNPI